MAKDDLGGVWRTIGGRRVFIKDGQSISDAMKVSGKFKKGEKTNEVKEEINKDEIKEKEPTFEEKREYLKQKGIDELNNFTKDDDDTFIRKEYDRQKALENETKQAKETGKSTLINEYNKTDSRGSMSDDSFIEQARKAGMSDENIAKEVYKKHNGPESNNTSDNNIKRLLAKQGKEEALANGNTEKAEMFEKYENRFAERVKSESPKETAYKTRDVKDYQDENGTWHINDTAKNEIDKEVSMMSGKDLKEAYNSLEKNDNSYEARAIRGEYNQRQVNEEKFHQTTQSMINNSGSDDDSFTMTNGNREVTVSRDDSGKWVDSDGNKYMGYLSKSDVKSYFKGDWKEAKPESTNDIMNNAIREGANKRKVPGTNMPTTDDKDARNTMYKTIQSDANKRYDNKEISKEERNSIIDNAHDKFIKQKEDTKISISDALRRKAYQKYLKEHPNSKMTFNDFMK